MIQRRLYPPHAVGEEEYEPAHAPDQAHVHGQAQLALTLHHFLQQGRVP